MPRLEDVKFILIDNEDDESFFRMVLRDACNQMKVKEEENAVTAILRGTGFLGMKGKIVFFEITSGYRGAEKADKVIKRVYKRLYMKRAKHNIHALMPKEPKPVKFEVLTAEWDVHRMEEKSKSL